jgi:molybdopterin-guanine dinucleotide biosynthesis protein B
MTSIITLVGVSNSGKTTVASELIRILTKKGYKVAAVKHCPHGHDVDRQGSDTHRLAQAGAPTVIAVSPNKVTQIERTEFESSLELIVKDLDGFDLIVAEGFKHSMASKIQIRKGGRTVPLEENVVAIVTDEITSDPCALESGKIKGTPTYRFDEMDELAIHIRELFLGGTDDQFIF